MTKIISGNLVIESGKVFIQGENGDLTELTEENTIKIERKNGDRFQRVALRQIVSNYEKYGWSVYAGIYSIVELKGE